MNNLTQQNLNSLKSMISSNLYALELINEFTNYIEAEHILSNFEVLVDEWIERENININN